MEIPTQPNLTSFKFFKIIEEDAAITLQAEVNRGWSLIAVGVKRIAGDYDGDQFRDEFIYMLGRNDPEP